MHTFYIKIKNLGLNKWNKIAQLMYEYTSNRNENSIDEIWLVEHFPIYTIGQNYTQKKIFTIKNIPVFYSNRGGKTTYHGPGQQLVYFLLDLTRLKLNIREFINIIENIILNTLYNFNILGTTVYNSPGIFVNKEKICFIGLRIKNGCSLHGLALNVNMNLYPFTLINPCGLNNVVITQIKNFQPYVSLNLVKKILIKNCIKHLKHFSKQKNFNLEFLIQ